MRPDPDFELQEAQREEGRAQAQVLAATAVSGRIQAAIQAARASVSAQDRSVGDQSRELTALHKTVAECEESLAEHQRLGEQLRQALRKTTAQDHTPTDEKAVVDGASALRSARERTVVAVVEVERLVKRSEPLMRDAATGAGSTATALEPLRSVQYIAAIAPVAVALAWPVAALIALAQLRTPLEHLTGRASKVSFGGLAIEVEQAAATLGSPDVPEFVSEDGLKMLLRQDPNSSYQLISSDATYPDPRRESRASEMVPALRELATAGLIELTDAKWERAANGTLSSAEETVIKPAAIESTIAAILAKNDRSDGGVPLQQYESLDLRLTEKGTNYRSAVIRSVANQLRKEKSAREAEKRDP